MRIFGAEGAEQLIQPAGMGTCHFFESLVTPCSETNLDCSTVAGAGAPFDILFRDQSVDNASDVAIGDHQVAGKFRHEHPVGGAKQRCHDIEAR